VWLGGKSGKWGFWLEVVENRERRKFFGFVTGTSPSLGVATEGNEKLAQPGLALRCFGSNEHFDGGLLLEVADLDGGWQRSFLEG